MSQGIDSQVPLGWEGSARRIQKVRCPISKRQSDTEKYNKKFMRELPAPYKILWDYLYLNCSHAGIWHVEIDVAQLRVGQDAPISAEEAIKQFNKDQERVIVLDNGKKWFIKGFVEFQQSIFSLSGLNPINKVHASIINILKKEGIPLDLEPIDEDNGNEKPPKPAKFGDFESLWVKYPKPVNKKEALRHFNASVRTEKDWQDIQKALTNYLSSARVLNNIIQDGKTWFNNWQDWVTYTEKLCQKCKNKGRYVNSNGYDNFCDCEIGKKMKGEQPKYSPTM